MVFGRPSERPLFDTGAGVQRSLVRANRLPLSREDRPPPSTYVALTDWRLLRLVLRHRAVATRRYTWGRTSWCATAFGSRPGTLVSLRFCWPWRWAESAPAPRG